MDESTLITFGGAVKALGDGKVAGYLVRFSGPKDTDLEGDFFTPGTVFGPNVTPPVFYHHGFDGALKARVLGQGQLKIDDVGVWVEAQLEMRDEYEKMIYALAEQGKLGWSSGAVGHLVEREALGKAWWVKTWIIGEASLTPTPAEPRNAAITLKAYSEWAGRPALDDADADQYQNSKVGSQGDNEMNEQDVNQAVQAAVAKALAERDAHDQAKAELKAQLDAAKAEGRKEAEAELKGNRKGGYAYHKTATRGDGDDAQVGAWKYWIRTGDVIAARRELDEVDPTESADGKHYKSFSVDDEGNVKTALAEGAGANGGYLVPSPYYDRIIAKRDEKAIVLRAGALPIPTSLSSVSVPVENAKQGNFAIVAEAGAADESEPTFAQVAITVYAWRRLQKLSWELMQDQQADLDPYLANSTARALALTLNNYTLVGTGSGQPQGAVVGGTSAVTAASATAVTVQEVLNLLYAIGSDYTDNCVLTMRRTVEGTLRGLTTNFLAFQSTPASGSAANPKGGNLEAGNISTYPVMNSGSMAAMTTGQKPILFGNWEYYGLAQRQGLVMQRANELYMANGQIGLFWWTRWGGAVLQSEAFQYITMA